jgi:hypothetical protein
MLTWRKRLIKSNPFLDEMEKEKLLGIFYKNIDMKMILESLLEEKNRIADEKYRILKNQERCIQIKKDSILGLIIRIALKIKNVASFRAK